jgi:hypothetical protein
VRFEPCRWSELYHRRDLHTGPGGPAQCFYNDHRQQCGQPPLTLNGVGVNPGPNATLSATSLTFANQAVGTTSPAQSITLSNYGTATLNIASMAASANFGETNTCASSLAPGANCTISVTFMPSAAGGLNGTISVTDNALGSPQMVPLGGSGIGPGVCQLKGQECAPVLPPCCSGLLYAWLRETALFVNRPLHRKTPPEHVRLSTRRT